MEYARLQREQSKSEPDTKKTRSSRTVTGSNLSVLDTGPPVLRLGTHSHGSAARVVQAKLNVSHPGDQYEQEADRVAEQVMGMPDPTLRLHRKCGCGGSTTSGASCACNEPLVQRQAMSHSDSEHTAPGIVHEVLRSPGQQMDKDTREFFERRLGRDFSAVRLHTDAKAAESARAVNAVAYTVGQNVAFGAGRYAPNTNAGRGLLAHELTHVVQQRGTAESAQSKLAFDQPRHASEHEAESTTATLASMRGPGDDRLMLAASPPQLQRSCADGDCRTCAGGRKDFWVTVFFRRRATQDTMTKLRAQINGAKAILANCCLNLKFDFNWTLLPGGGSLPAYQGNPAGVWNYTADEHALGQGTTFSGARGIPMLLVDDVPLSGGGVTVDPRFDTTYAGRDYFAIGINQTSTPNPNCNHIAHELWHVASGLSAHDPANGAITSCTGPGVSLTYCNPLRALV